MSSDDPQCPECGEPVGQRAQYCMHCSAEFSRPGQQVDSTAESQIEPNDEEQIEPTVEGVADADGEWAAATDTEPSHNSSTINSHETPAPASQSSSEHSGDILADDGLIDDSLTVIVGLGGGIIVGVFGTVILGVATSSLWALPVGAVGGLLVTAYLVRRQTVQAAVAHSGYAVAAVFLTVPLLSLSPTVAVDTGTAGQADLLVRSSFITVLLAALPATVGWVASQFVAAS